MKLFTLFADLSLDTSKFNKGVEQASSAGVTLQNNFQAISAKTVAMGHALYDVGKTVATSAINFTKSIFSEYAETEQLLGGVETIFKDSAQTVINNASKAYETAGMSANEYMQTVTNFSSSLLKSLGGDTQKAAEVADMAVQDMSDNANKFGTDIGAIQNAYQGFAKQNYTMLDNLKLGYGGTKSEMQKLLKDAAKIQKANGVNVKYNINNLDDIYEAIHVIQTEMGITGTTAEEAAKTLSGSFKAFGASWKNLLSGMGRTDTDIKVLLENMFKAGENVISNIFDLLPQIGESAKYAFTYIVEKAKEAAPDLYRIFRNAWDTKLPAIVKDGANTIISTINSIFGTNIPAIESIDFPTWDKIEAGFKTWWNSTKTNIETGAKWVLGIFTNPTETAEEIKATFSTWWNGTARPSIESACQWTLQMYTLPDAQNESASAYIQSWWDKTGTWLSNLCSWQLQMFNMPSETADDVGSLVKTWWNGVNTGLTDIVMIPVSLVAGDTEAAKGIVSSWWDSVMKMLGDTVLITYDINEPAVGPIVDKIKSWWDSVTAMLNLHVDAGVNVHASESGVTHGGGGSSFGDASLPSHGGSGRSFGDASLPSHKNGLDRVPYDGYVAELHRDEAVLTSQQASDWRQGNQTSDTMDMGINQAVSLLKGILSAVQSPIPAVIDGNEAYDYVMKRLTWDIETRSKTYY